MNKLINIFRKLQVLSVLLIPLISIIFIILLVLLLSDTPLKTLYYYFMGPFVNIFHFGNMFNASVPFIIGALGITSAMKAGSLNLGGEGQVYLGAFLSTIIALYFSKSFIGQQMGIFASIIAIICGSFFSAIASAFSGYCKAKWNANELITSFLLSCAIIPIVNFLVTGPFADPDTSLLSTGKIAENMRFALILKPSALNASVFAAILLAALIHIFLFKTRTGYEIRITGLNEMFARYGGINTKFYTVLTMAISGFMYGLAGSAVVFGTNYAVIKDFSSGLGWSALTTALFAGFSPLAIIPCALFLSWINAGARIAMQNSDITFEIAYIVQAVIFILSTSFIVKNSVLKEKLLTDIKNFHFFKKRNI